MRRHPQRSACPAHPNPARVGCSGPSSGAADPPFTPPSSAADSIEEYLDKGFSYARTGNPTVTTLERKIAGLESGYGAACFSTGMAATISVIAGTMKAGDHCVITNCSYGGTNRACRTMFTDMGMAFDLLTLTLTPTLILTLTLTLALILTLTLTPTLTLTLTLTLTTNPDPDPNPNPNPDPDPNPNQA